jgi:hypothetical protein
MSLSLEDSKSVWIMASLCVASAARLGARERSFERWRGYAPADADYEAAYGMNGHGVVPRGQPARP